MRRRMLATMLVISVAAGMAVPAGAGAGQGSLYALAMDEPSAQELVSARQAGARSARILVNWGGIEFVQGAYYWDNTDALMRDAASAGIEVVPLLIGVPHWMSSHPRRPPLYSPEQRASWTRYIAAIAARYGPGGEFWRLNPTLPHVPVRYWQLWNEVNLPFYWGGRPSPKRYADLLRMTRPALRAASPSAKLVFAGMLPFRSRAPGEMAPQKFLTRLYKRPGVRKLFDVFAAHPYGGTPAAVRDQTKEMRGLLRELGDGRVPIWLTEFGWTTGGEEFATSPFKASEAVQAKRVTRVYRMLRGARARLRIGRAFYFILKDFNSASNNDWFTHMGLLRADGSPKPAWFAFARAAP